MGTSPAMRSLLLWGKPRPSTTARRETPFSGKLADLRRDNEAGLKRAIREGIDAFVKEYAPQGASGQALRMARRFGLLSLAGQFATAWGLTGWEEGEADGGCGACYLAWLESSGAEAQEDRKLVEQVRASLEKHGASRFQDSTKLDAFTVNWAGYWRDHGGTRQYLVTPEAFKELVKGHDPRRAAKVLQSKGLLLPGGDGKYSQSLYIAASGQKSTRVYVIVVPEEAP